MSRRPRRPSTRRRTVSSKSVSVSPAGAKTYKIGEAARQVGVKAYVLRFWESEFPMLRPAHTQSRHRVYSNKDIENFRLLKRLLHEERLTIEGAKRRIKEVGLYQTQEGTRDQGQLALGLTRSESAAHGEAITGLGNAARRILNEIRRDLQSLLKLISE